jgi:F-type H+-transporting ATPase subunit b
MEQTLQALSGLLLKAIPTICLFVLLYFYIKSVLFGPLEKILKQRDELTVGARKAAEASLALAERKEKEYEAKFAEARAEVYKLQEDTRRQWLDDQAAQLAEAHARSGELVKKAKDEIARDSAAARDNLFATSAQLADEITNAVLSRKAGA